MVCYQDACLCWIDIGTGGKLKMKRDTVRRPEPRRCRQNLPIESNLKIKRVYQTEPIDPTSWAYMRALRLFGNTKKIYPANPYVEVYQFQANVYGLLTENADGMGDPWMYLVIGTKKAMLIDTGFGIGDLKGLCELLTGGKELIVVNTHGHPDHAGGNAQFDQVFCHEYDVPMLKAQNPDMWDYLFEYGDRKQRGIWSDFDERDIIPFNDYQIVGCQNGHLFDLGEGHTVELVHLGGHSPGSCGFLDRATRSLFTGDDLLSMRVGVFSQSSNPYSEQMKIHIMRDAFEKLATRKAEFDHVFPGHFVTDLENVTVDAMLDACNAICADPIGNCSYRTEGETDSVYSRYVDGLGTISYTLDSV